LFDALFDVLFEACSNLAVVIVAAFSVFATRLLLFFLFFFSGICSVLEANYFKKIQKSLLR
jgi:hypothetical protein